ncbi:MAG: hypothetical protein ACM3VS_09355 [Candidatus Dadabacteria bacterium]
MSLQDLNNNVRQKSSLILLIIVVFACSSKKQSATIEPIKHTQKHVEKPGSTYQDTLFVSTAAAIFYKPDSIQLQKLKAAEDDQVFKGSMHEFFYMVRNAHIFLKQNWPRLKVVESANIRYLGFLEDKKIVKVIDLDKEQDPIGMFVYDGHKNPLLIDMTNIDTQVPDYFKGTEKIYK